MPSHSHLFRVLLPLIFIAAEPRPGGALAARANLPLPPLVERFLNRQDEALRSYKALRHLEAHNRRYGKHGWMQAWTTLDEGGFRFEIVAEGGSSYVRDKVLRKALEREAEAFARGENAAAALAPANYTFAEQEGERDGTVAVTIEPLRTELTLLRGRIYLKQDDADLVRLEGQLVKAPSFWTRRVHITRQYSRVDGVRVPISTESVADLRVAGRSTFLMRYQYVSINGRHAGQPQPAKPLISAADDDK